MIEIIRERILDAPISRVWDLIRSVEHLSRWFSGVETAMRLEGEGLGRRQRTTGSWGRHRFEIDQTVIEYEVERVLGWRHDAERLDGKPAPRMSRQTEVQVRLQALDDRTGVSLRSRQLPGNVFKGLLIRLIAAPRIARMMDRSLDQMAALVQRSVEGSGGLTCA